MIYAVLRKPCLMEDEGRYHFLKAFDTREEAEKYVDFYTENDKGYFKKSDLEIHEQSDLTRG